MDKPANYTPEDLHRMMRRVQRDRQLCDTGVEWWITPHDKGAKFVVRGISRVDGQAKRFEIEL